MDPEVRLTAKDGLSHPYLSEFHDPENEPISPPYDDSFESLELAVSEWKSETYNLHTYWDPFDLVFIHFHTHKIDKILCFYHLFTFAIQIFRTIQNSISHYFSMRNPVYKICVMSKDFLVCEYPKIQVFLSGKTHHSVLK